MYPNPYEQNPYDQRQAGSGGNVNPQQNPPSSPNPYGPPNQSTVYGSPSNPEQYAPAPPPPPSPSNPQWDRTVRADDPSQYPAVPAPANPNQYQQTAPSQYPPQQGQFPASPNQYPPQQGQFPSNPNQYVQPNQYAAPTTPNQFPSSPNQYQGMGTFNPPPTPPKRSSTMRIVLIALVALVVIGGSLAAFFVVSGHNTQVANDNATATARVNSTNTAIAQTTATANAQITATANAQATAVAVTSTYPFSANVKLNDPLSDNGKGFGWKTDSYCQFLGGAYHAIARDANTYVNCPAVTPSFTNFTYQVTVQYIKGDAFGITFRGDDKAGTFYDIEFDETGAYTVRNYTSTTDTEITHGTASNLQTGGSNIIGVVAKGSDFTFYLNNQQLTQVTDSSYASGQIGCFSLNLGNYADAAFSNAKVWDLTQTQ